MISRQETQIDAELVRRGVKAHVVHIKHPEDSYFKVVTVATKHFATPSGMHATLSHLYQAAYRQHRSNVGAFIHDAFEGIGAGVALCHYRDNFNRSRGRIIAKGRLLKLLKNEEENKE